MKTKPSVIIFQVALMGILSSCSESPTNQEYSTAITGAWINTNTDSVDVTNDTGKIIGRTELTEIHTMTIIEGGILKTSIKWHFNPQNAPAQSTETAYTGSWRTSNDTLYRDSNPGALGSLDTNIYFIQYNTLVMRSISTNKTKYFARVK